SLSPPPKPPSTTTTTTSSIPSSKLTAKALTCRRSRRLSTLLSIFLLLLSPVFIRHTTAVSCIYPDSTTTVQPGDVLPVTWQLTALDSVVYDTVYAELYCMNQSGTGPYSQTPYGYLVAPVGVLQTQDEMSFKFPNCGPAVTGAIKIVATAQSIQLQASSECHFSIQAAIQLQPTASSQAGSPTTTTTAPAGTSPVVIPPLSSGASAIQPLVPSLTLTSVSPGATNSAGSSIITASSYSGSSGSGQLSISSTYSSNLVTIMPTLPSFTGSSGQSGQNSPNGTNDPTSPHISRSLTVVNRRRRAAARVLPQSMVSKSKSVAFGGTGGVMIESRSRFRLKRKPKGGHFYKMDDQDDYDEVEVHAGKSSDKGANLASASLATGGAAATLGLNDKEEISVTTPQQAHLDAPPMSYMRGAPSPFPYPSSHEYTMSSIRSSFDQSSVIRKYWEASMAARVASNATQDQVHVDGESYEEGSIFGDGSSRDSESRMADILSLRTTGSSADTLGTLERYNNRRSTLKSMGEMSSFSNERSLTTTLSSIPDSLMISEEEFLERLAMHERQMQLEQEYYNQYHSGHNDRYPSRSTFSRTSTTPSLTSTNDPFQTFDSNEVLVEADPFSDSRAASRASRRSNIDY
ncbi:hypothetical protein BGZ49_009456, partial [Haplosporangium sp. Z 27]